MQPDSFEAFDMSDQEDVFKRPRKPDDSEMDITPMIDITFLLLIFFLVASKMDADAEVALPKAKNGTAVTTKESAFITITEGTGDQSIIYTGNGAVEENRIKSSDLAEQEAIISAYTEKMLVQEHKEQVVIKAAKDVKHREVARVMQAVGQVESAKIYVAVLEEG